MSSVNCCLRARFTFLNLSNSVSTGGAAVRAETLGGAGFDFFERELHQENYPGRSVQDKDLMLDASLCWTRCHNVQDNKLSWTERPV